MKKCLLVLMVLCISCFVGCGEKTDHTKEESTEQESTEQESVVDESGTLEDEKDATWVKLYKVGLSNGGGIYEGENGGYLYGMRMKIKFPATFGISDIASVKYTVENASGEFKDENNLPEKINEFRNNDADGYVREGSDQSGIVYTAYYIHKNYTETSSKKWFSSKVREIISKIRLLTEVTKNDGTVELHKYAIKFSYDYNESSGDLYEIINP